MGRPYAQVDLGRWAEAGFAHAAPPDRRRAFRLRTTGLIVLLALVSGAAVWSVIDRQHRLAAAEDARHAPWPPDGTDEVLSVGREHAQVLSSYDYRRFDEVIDEIGRRSTAGSYRAGTQNGLRWFRAHNDKNRLVREATTVDIGPVEIAEGDAVLLAFLDVRESDVNGTREYQIRVLLTLERSNGQWLVSGLEDA